jgi:exonuclease III
VKDQEYDDQTQRTGQVMVSSTAVQAELKTVSDSVEDITNTISTSNTSTPIEIDKCYNKFLKQHNLPQILKPVSLNNFIHHLHLNLFFNPIKISINSKKTETHIYLHTAEPTLPDHTIINSSFYKTYGHLPLLTSFNWSIPNINHAFFSTSDQSSNLDTSTPSSTSLLSTTLEHTSIPIKIGTININGLQQSNKKLSLIDFLQNNNFEIFGLSETHISVKDGKFFNNQINNYVSFWSSYSNTSQAGVGILVRKNISKYIARSHNYQGHVIGLDFNFKNTPTRLIQIYNPTYEKKELRKEVLDYIISLTQNTKYKIIIMGDFNSVPNPRINHLPSKKSSISESQLIKYLISFQFKDIYHLFFSNTYNYTFHRSSIQSRIDQIWTNLSITNVDYTDIFLNHNTESDYHVLTLEISIIINKP